MHFQLRGRQSAEREGEEKDLYLSTTFIYSYRQKRKRRREKRRAGERKEGEHARLGRVRGRRRQWLLFPSNSRPAFLAGSSGADDKPRRPGPQRARRSVAQRGAARRGGGINSHFSGECFPQATVTGPRFAFFAFAQEQSVAARVFVRARACATKRIIMCVFTSPRYAKDGAENSLCLSLLPSLRR